MVARLPIQARRSTVFDLIVAGKSYADICAQLDMSEDTVARDMAAIGAEITVLYQDRLSEILAVALAHLEAARDAAWREYQMELERERAWFAGELDYATVERTVKSAAAGDVAASGVTVAAVQALDVSEKHSQRRPGWRSNRAKWLDLVVSTTKAICELVGLKRLLESDGDDSELVVRVEYGE